LFVAFFAAVTWSVFTALRRLPDPGSEEHVLGRALLAVLAAVLVIIFTVSPISIVPLIYWSVGAMGVAYAGMLRRDSTLK
jgi:hypothetical protein